MKINLQEKLNTHKLLEEHMSQIPKGTDGFYSLRLKSQTINKKGETLEEAGSKHVEEILIKNKQTREKQKKLSNQSIFYKNKGFSEDVHELLKKENPEDLISNRDVVKAIDSQFFLQEVFHIEPTVFRPR